MKIKAKSFFLFLFLSPTIFLFSYISDFFSKIIFLVFHSFPFLCLLFSKSFFSFFSLSLHLSFSTRYLTFFLLESPRNRSNESSEKRQKKTNELDIHVIRCCCNIWESSSTFRWDSTSLHTFRGEFHSVKIFHTNVDTVNLVTEVLSKTNGYYCNLVDLSHSDHIKRLLQYFQNTKNVRKVAS